MSLDLIGAGFGRTGTLSLKAALEQLGFAPCYHMTEVVAHLEHAAVWDGAARGNPPDWHDFLAGYRAAVDWPVCAFWRELAEAFPDAKILLSLRDPEAWYKSMSQTIFEILARADAVAEDPVRGPQIRMARYIVEEMSFGGRTDREHAIAVYNAHIETVKREVPAGRLLVYNVAEGWEPLCGFLGVAVPTTPFPRTNSTEEFRSRMPRD